MQVFYVVRPDDTLSNVAKRWELPLDSLLAANNLNETDKISRGQQLSMPPGVEVYKVQTGDSVYRISQLYGVPLAVIIEANELTAPYILQANQLLKIPAGVPYYVVQEGDTLDQIAKRFNVTREGRSGPVIIEKINKLSSTVVDPGMKLEIPHTSPNELGFLAYTSNRGGKYDIWVYDLQSGENEQLTTGLGDSFSQPVWSPDSSGIAFVGKDRIIYVIYLTTGLIGGVDQLTEGGDFTLDWSPDSVSLAYAARGMIVLYNAILHEALEVRQSDASDVSWFPSGRELLFQAPDASGVSQLYRCETIGTNKWQLTNNSGGPLQHARLSPDGLYALYTTPGANVSLIETVEISTGKVFEVEGGPEAKNYFPVWSPDSLRIAYSATAFADKDYYSQIRSVDRHGQNDQVSALADCFSTPVTWSPNGGAIAYLSGCKELGVANQMWIVNVIHPVPVKLIGGVNIMSMQWSPTAVGELAKKEYTSELFDVNLQYPANWERVNDERYEGGDGFFQISAIFGSNNIEEVCHDEAFQELMPYGSMPKIINSSSAYIIACTILPSDDQLVDMKGQAAYIVQYPDPITIGEDTYNYLILWADKDHIKEISSTIQFLP
ncbi:LysM peptidoglycan-binding domain-containing protein [Sporosarcina sp. G11-34]|uniref:LysM peptidoglycan-binding domain-containing protein n=1 Tax=Sporosarcina sp. G11-34 TaxID=2849605 RepID=UPI0022A90071|nr:LysM peptidoglycan-binding domain-containing protein [Sporosarcina sp. G11-34]MCZ2260852.1 LysM peptidoglycan-binding domain-containing protein [Sporosarcina sp. G11-34]